MEKYLDGFGSMLKQVRKILRLTQANMAELLDITVRHYQALEKGNKKPGAEIVYRLVYKAGVSPSQVLMLPTSDDDPQYREACQLLMLCSEDQLETVMLILRALLKIPI